MYKSESMGGPSEGVEASRNAGQPSARNQSQERESFHLDAAVGKLLEGEKRNFELCP